MPVSATPADILNGAVRSPPLAARGASWSSEVTESGEPYWCLSVPVGSSGLQVEAFVITEANPTFYATDLQTDVTYVRHSFWAALEAVMMSISESPIAPPVLELAPFLAAEGQLDLPSNTKLNLQST
jgi:hypothetical protein